MPSVPPVPLAWRNLVHDWVRFALFAAGIAFAVVLMAVQYGIMMAMLDGNTLLIGRLNGDLILVNPNKASLLFRDTINRRRMEMATTVPGVARVDPVYIDYQAGELRHTAADPRKRTQTRGIRVVGIDPESGVLDLPDVPAEDWQRLHIPGTALYDRLSRPHPDQEHHPGESVFGVLANGTRTELSGRQITLVGNGFALGFDFGCDGTLVVSERTFAQYLRAPYTASDPLADVSIGVVRLQPGADPHAVRHQLQQLYASEGDIKVLTRDQLIDREKRFWWLNTPIGFAFGAGVALGFVVGLVICYQILASDVADHLPEYATLKAIGYTNRHLSLVILQEALILAVSGFALGLLVSLGVYHLLTALTGLPVRATPGRLGLIFCITIVMCIASGLMALGTVKKADPADVF